MGERIRVQRESLNISREQFAEMLGVTTKFCGDIESGARGTSPQTLTKIFDCLMLSTDYILFGESSKTSDQIFL
ncbi:MAG: helix-turn-helix transcriptional regulator [Muricomes sp.]